MKKAILLPMLCLITYVDVKRALNYPKSQAIQGTVKTLKQKRRKTEV